MVLDATYMWVWLAQRHLILISPLILLNNHNLNNRIIILNNHQSIRGNIVFCVTGIPQSAAATITAAVAAEVTATYEEKEED